MNKIYKYCLLTSLMLLSQVILSQHPGDNIHFGKLSRSLDELLEKSRAGDRPYYLPEKTKVMVDSTMKISLSDVFVRDTVSVSVNGCFFEFRDDQINKAKPKFVYYSEHVTNEDWNMFDKYCLDSTLRKRLGLKYDEFVWLYPAYYENGKERRVDEWNINWDQELKFKNLSEAELFLVLDYVYAWPDRFNGQIQIDPRKLFYAYHWKDRLNEEQIIEERVSIFRDSTIWISDSSSNHYGNIEDGLVNNYNHHHFYKEMPVVGINQPQARAYLNWLESLHNKHLKEIGAEYFVEYEIPSHPVSSSTKVLSIPEFDLSCWRITNKEYLEFINYVRDSIALRALSEELNYDHYYSMEPDNIFGFEYAEEDWIINWKSKIDWKRKTGGEKFMGKKAPYGILDWMFYPLVDGDTNLIDKRKLIFEYDYYDQKKASIGTFKQKENDGFSECAERFNYCDKSCYDYYQESCYNGVEYFGGKDLNLSVVNSKCQSSDVFAHEVRFDFIIKDKIAVYPGINYRQINEHCDPNCMNTGEVFPKDNCRYFNCEICPQVDDWNNLGVEEYDFKTKPNDLIEGITYYQFRAYWMWYNREIRGREKRNPVIADYIPSKEEFEKLWIDEHIIHPEEIFLLPSPSLYYVIKYYLN